MNKKVLSKLLLLSCFLFTVLGLKAEDNSKIPLKTAYSIASDFCDATYHQDYADKLRDNEGWEDLQRVTWDASLSDIKLDIEKSNNFVQYPITNPNYTVNLVKYDSSKIYPKQHYAFVIASKKIDGKNVYVIAFRGTVDNYSWILTDFMAWPTEFLHTNTQVHSGFEWYREASNKNEKLKDFLKRIKEDENPCVVVTGHSLGAAAAVLEAAYLVETNVTSGQNIMLIPLAEPCPGKKDFTERYEHAFNVYKFFGNNLDPVPILPGLVGYAHFGDFVSFSLGPLDVLMDRHSLKYYQEYIKKITKK